MPIQAMFRSMPFPKKPLNAQQNINFHAFSQHLNTPLTLHRAHDKLFLIEIIIAIDWLMNINVVKKCNFICK